MGALRVGVFGAGAIGCYVGGKLAAHGVSVVLVGRPRLRDEIQTSGMTLEDLSQPPQNVSAEKLGFTTEAARLADCDVVCCCVKSAQTASAGDELARVLSPTAIVASLQNGVRNADVLREHLGDRLVLGGIVGFNVVANGPKFRRATTGPLVLSASDHPRAKELVSALTRCGFDVEVSSDIRPKQWSKLVMNVNNAVGALTDAPTRELIFSAEYRRILALVMGESLGVMRRAGIKPARLGAVPAQLFPVMLRLPTPILRLAARAQLKVDPEARSSMWDDVSRGRLTEVDHLNGEIVRLAESIGGDAPVNRKIVDLIHDVEARGGGSPKMSADALWRELTTRG